MTRVLLCAGKVYYDLASKREKDGDTSTAILRLEQLYPLDHNAIQAALAPYGDAEIVWVQEEPRNQGAWTYLAHALPHVIGREVRGVTRHASASPASGLSSRHQAEQADVVERAFAR